MLTVGQVYELADRTGMRPMGNIRATPDGYRLRFAQHGVMWTLPERYTTRQGAERALWKVLTTAVPTSPMTGGFTTWPDL